MNQALARFETYRAALAVNNMGVSLLEHGCFEDAVKTFKDSLILLKAAISACIDHKLDRSSSSNTNAEQRLEAATARLSNARVNPKATHLGIVACDEEDVSEMKASLRYGPSASLFYPIRIRGDSLDKLYENVVDMQSSMMLYNHGLAQLLCYYQDTTIITNDGNNHKSSTPEKASNWLLGGALRSLSFARSILSQKFVSGDEGKFQRLWAVLVTALILNNMFQVFKAQKQPFQANEVLVSLEALRETVKRQETMDHEAGMTTARRTAPAA